MPNSPERLSDCIYYAIGDVHGELDRLLALHEAVFAYHEAFHGGAGIRLVHLGDYVDRGPDACGVIEALIKIERLAEGRADLEVICLRGNHEQLMLDALDEPEGATMRTWVRPAYGGQKTLDSYALREEAGYRLRDAHCAWIRQLPAIWAPPETPYIFVHAGVDPVLYPLEDDEIYIWTRSPEFFNPDRWRSRHLSGRTVIHGHTPTSGEPDIAGGGRRINVDTGAVYGGPLTCAVLDPQSGNVSFLKA